MLPRRRRAETPTYDPSTLSPDLRAPVRSALGAQAQFAALVARMPTGPLRTRLDEMTPRIAAGVQAVWDTAHRADQIGQQVALLDPERATAELKAARRAGAADEVVAAKAARFDSIQRLLNARDAAVERLPVAEARLEAAVARAAEIAIGNADLDALDLQLDAALLDLAALSAALDVLS